jgi:5-oxopent-3-ene-1,2,5-tricarboxylate decarboxylase/2-hydroxyhepta-2,4-diene-1,7-dioate isomerase
MNLQIRTSINDQLTQEGTTKDMIFDIPALIEYLSSFMTLDKGDIILTGTPEGLKGVKAGDKVVAEIEGIGRLENMIVGDSKFNRKSKVDVKESTVNHN